RFFSLARPVVEIVIIVKMNLAGHRAHLMPVNSFASKSGSSLLSNLRDGGSGGLNPSLKRPSRPGRSKEGCWQFLAVPLARVRPGQLVPALRPERVSQPQLLRLESERPRVVVPVAAAHCL